MSIYKRSSDCDYVSIFLSTFFAVLLAGFMLLLLTRWYIRETAKDVKEATDIYLKHRLKKISDDKN